MKLTLPITHISVQGDTVTLEFPKQLFEEIIHVKNASTPRTDWNDLERLYGSWRGKGVDGLTIERRLREEWNGRP